MHLSGQFKRASGFRRNSDASSTWHVHLTALLLVLVLSVLASLERVVRVNAQQPEGASITGTVEDDQGQLVQDAKVTLIRQEVSSSVLTHADGKFEFKKVLPGPCELTVEVAGFRRQSIKLMISRAGENLVQVVRLVASSLHVAVFDSASRQPLAGAAVTLAGGERGVQPAARSLTDEGGDAFFGRLTPGSYRLTASLRGYDDYQSVVFISSAKITTEFALPLSIAPVIPINDKAATRYNVPNIPSKNVQAVFQDSEGWMWFGTDKGIARFNGSDFRSSSTGASAFSWIAGTDVKTIAEDNTGLIWLGTSRGIRKISKDGSDSGELLNGLDVRNIFADAQGSFWIATSSGEYEVNPDGTAPPARINGLASSDVRVTAEDRHGRIYIATSDGVSVWENRQVKAFDLRPSAATRTSASTSKGVPSKPGASKPSAATKPQQPSAGALDVRSIYTDRNGTLWFGTSIGVMYYDGTASVPVETEAVRSADSPALSSGVRTVGQDSAGRLWFGLDSGGALLYGPERRETQRIGLVERDRVVDIFTDREGNLWFGTDNGAVRADLYSFVDFNTSRGLLDNDVRWVVQKTGSQGNPSTNQDMLFATAGGVSVMEHERLIPLEGFRANIGVRTIAFDRDGAAWFATGQGAFRLSQQSLTQLNEGNGLLSDNVNWVSGAAGGSMIVFGTSKGLGIFKEGSLTAVDPLSGFDIRQVAEGPAGRLWCSTNRGVVTYDPPTGDTLLIDTGRGLADNDVRWITASPDRMFIATAAGVQSCVANLPAGDGHENLSLETVDTEPATTLFLDRDGYLWSGTVDGQVRKFVIISHQYISTVYSGETAALGGKRINSFCEDSAGHIWIATSGGVVRHTPVRVAPLARLSGEADGRPLQSQPQQGAVTASYDLPYGAGKLTFRFTGVSLDGQVRYLYRLNRPGADEAWRLLPVQQAAEREVAISNVGNGSVTFELMALNRDLYGVMAPAAELPLNIGPPFWRHTWFYLIALSVIAAVVSAAFVARRIEHREFSLPKELRTFVPVEPNPYIVGNPIRTETMFFGREDDFRYTRTKLEGVSQGVVIVFCGERRVGKSSILYQVLNGRLGERFVPVFVDMQEMVISSDAEFFARISRLIGDAVRRASKPAAITTSAGAASASMASLASDAGASVAVAPVAPSALARLPVPAFDGRNPYPVFLDYLDEVLRLLDKKTLLILVDEYELMESKVDEGKLSQELFTFLAGLMDNKERLALIFTGSRRLEERDRKYWRELLRRSLFRKVSFISEKDTVRLVTEPVAGKVVYGRGVVEQVYRLTAGQPFYAQVICQNIVDFLNEQQRNWFTQSDLGKVIEEIVDNPLPQMIYAWDGLSDDEKIALSLLAEHLDDQIRFATAGELRSSVKINNYPVNLSENTIRLTLEEMFRREFLDKDAVGGFRFRMDLFRLWVRRGHSIWQVVNEVRTL